MPRAAVPPDVREAILDAAAHLMEQYGYKKMTMDDIALEAQIGTATIYGYFSSKEDVALSVIDRNQYRIRAFCSEILAGAESPDARLRKMLSSYVLAVFDKAQRFKHSLDETLAALRPVVLPRREHHNAELAQLIAVVLKEGCDTGLFVCPDVDETAATLITCLSGLSPSNLSARELGERDEIENRVNRVLDLTMIGLLNRNECRNKDAGNVG